MTKINLTKAELKEQKANADFYLSLIQKELSYKDLVNTKNVDTYTKAYKHHLTLFNNGYITI